MSDPLPTTNGGASDPGGVGTFADIVDLLGQLPDADADVVAEIAAKGQSQAAALADIGRMADIAAWVGTWQGRVPPQVQHPRLCFFAAAHGIAGDVNQHTADLARSVINGDAPVNAIAEQVDMDLKVFDMGLEAPTRSFETVPAMTESETMTALAFGMTAVEPGVQLLAIADLGSGAKGSLATINEIFSGDILGGQPSSLEGDVSQVARRPVDLFKRPFTEPALRPLAVLQQCGGPDIAAMVGACIAARAVQVPVLVDGYAGLAAARILHALDERLIDHIRPAHSDARLHVELLPGETKMSPVIDLGLPPGSGVGAATAIEIVRAAVAAYNSLTDAAAGNG